MAIQRYLNQDIYLKTNVGIDKYGKPSYTNTILKGRFEYKTQLVKNKSGNDIISEARIYTLSEIKVEDAIEYNGINYNVIKVSCGIKKDGNIKFYEVFI